MSDPAAVTAIETAASATGYDGIGIRVLMECIDVFKPKKVPGTRTK